jgi:glc operon protein GlcG
MSRFGWMGAAAFMILVPAGVFAQTPTPASGLTYELAREAAEAAEQEARNNQWNVTIVVVDSAGVPVYLKRMTGASPRTFDFAIGKARTVVASGLSTLEYAQGVAAGTVQPVPDAVSIEGGIPIRVDGRVVGAVAASGVRPNQDAQVARAGVVAAES